MRVYIAATVTIATLVLVSFLVVEAFGIPLLVDPSDRLDDPGLAAASISVALLLLDVFIPVPSSIVMIANGAMFGVIGGTLLTLAGSVGGAMLGFFVGRKGTGLIRRFVSPREQERANALIARWGMLAIVVSRPIPIIAETITVMVGTTSITWRRMLVAATLGIIPAAVVYAIAGAFTTDIGSGVLVFGLVIFIAVATWFAGRKLETRLVPDATEGRDPTRSMRQGRAEH